MRTLLRNQQLVYFKVLTNGSEPILDDNGLPTGEINKVYGELQSVNIAFTEDKGEREDGIPGHSLNRYRIVLKTGDLNCPVNEETILWIGKSPADGAHNYEVISRSKSLNFITFIAKRVDVS